MKKIIIAIDGYSSCGKSTLAKDLASRLHYNYIDSGSMYRAVTYYMLEKNITIDQFKAMSDSELNTFLASVHITFQLNPDTKLSELYLNGKKIEEDIRTMRVSELVSPVSAIAAVRNKMVSLQHGYGKQKGIVMDGRDIGTKVFPEAELKIFMTASGEVRAKRRFDEMKAKEMDVTMEEVYRNIESRDLQDTTRALSPLRQAPDALVLDNSDLNKNEQMAIALEWVKERVENS